MKKTVKIVTIVLVIMLIILISFFGIFKQNLNSMKNIIPDYKLGTEFEGTRNFKFVVDTTESEETVYYDSEGNVVENVDENTDTSAYTSEKKVVKANEDDVLTKENYEKTKKIMQERLKKLKVSEYDIRLNNEDGSILVSIPQNDDTDTIYNVVGSVGKLEIVDKDTEEVLMDNSQLKKAEVVYNTTSTGTTVYLQLNFNKEGKEKLREISNIYVSKEVPKESTDTTTTETETKISYVKVNFDGSTLITTYFGEQMNDGVLQIPISQELTSTETIAKFIDSTNVIATMLNTGKLPISYTLENDNFIKSDITADTKNIAICAFEIVTAVLAVYMIIKYGKKGILAVIIHIGYIALLLLGLRYTNVIITISGLTAFVMITLVNYAFLFTLLKKMKEAKGSSEVFGITLKDLIIKIIPIIIVSVLFTVMSNAQVASFGMILFWGILIMLVYNLVFTRTIYRIKE